MNENHEVSDHSSTELQDTLRNDVAWVHETLAKTHRVLTLPNIGLETTEVVLDAIAAVTAHLLQYTGPLAGALALRLERDAGVEALERLANGE
jgi:hypothetical protein